MSISQRPGDKDNSRPDESGGLLTRMFDALFKALIRGILRLFGIGRQTVREAIDPLDRTYRAQLDKWAAGKIATWLHDTRPEIDLDRANYTLFTSADKYPETTQLIRDTLIDVKVTFTQRENRTTIDLEAFTSPMQGNRSVPQLLRWHAERDVTWAEVPDTIRERLIRSRVPVTVNYTIPGVPD